MTRLIILLLSSLIPITFAASSFAQSPPADAVERRVEAALRGTEPFAHGLRAAGQSIAEARARINLWIRFNVQRAVQCRQQGDADCVALHLGMAKHALRSAAIPWANDENGDPAVATRELLSRTRASEGYWRKQIDEDVQAMFDKSHIPGVDLLKIYGIDSENGPVDRPNQVPHPWRKPAG